MSSYIKGVVILFVMLDHYTLRYATHFAVATNSGWFGYGLAALFFVVSGYGIWRSLERRLDGGGLTIRIAAQFYLDRAVRIYPFYLLALLITPVYTPLGEMILHPSFNSVNIFLASPLVSGPGFFWFIHAIVQCYLLAPFLYIFIKWLGSRLSVWLILSLMIAPSIFTLMMYRSVPNAGASGFIYVNILLPNVPAGLFLSNVLLFGFGMASPALIARFKDRYDNRLGMAYAFTYMLTMLVVLAIGKNYEIRSILGPVLVTSMAVACLFAFGTLPRLPFEKLVTMLGNHSLTLYLLHVSFFIYAGRLGLFDDGSYFSAVFLILLMPLFIMICAGLEKGANRFIRGLTRKSGLKPIAASTSLG